MELIKRMQTAQEKFLDNLWQQRQENLPFKTKEEALILASIVEKETGIASERPHIAGLFINRLRKGMRLQSDPTIIYGLVGGIGKLGRGLRRSEIDKKTEYNTYQIDGLPPTPIANPGRAAIEAVLNPKETDDLYFVADGTGGHIFAKTLKEHNRNVVNWRKIEKQRKAEAAAKAEEEAKAAAENPAPDAGTDKLETDADKRSDAGDLFNNIEMQQPGIAMQQDDLTGDNREQSAADNMNKRIASTPPLPIRK
jgi:UPF0755 protein